MVRWYAVTYRCHARLSPIPVRHSGKNIHWIGLILNTSWRGTFNNHRHHPQPFDWLTCHRPSGRWFYIGPRPIFLPLPQSDNHASVLEQSRYATHKLLTLTPLTWIWLVEHACTDLSTYISFLLYCCKLQNIMIWWCLSLVSTATAERSFSCLRIKTYKDIPA